MMKRNPLTFDEAAELCIQYQDLKGELLLKDELGEHKIDCVAIAPFDELNQWIFAWFYSEYGCPLQALSYYHYFDYDVLLLQKTNIREKMIYKDLRTYLEEHRSNGMTSKSRSK